MKKVFLMFAVVGVIALSSCSKEHTCECTATAPGVDPITTSGTLEGKKGDAKTACEAGNSSVGGVTVACELK